MPLRTDGVKVPNRWSVFEKPEQMKKEPEIILRLNSLSSFTKVGVERFHLDVNLKVFHQ